MGDKFEIELKNGKKEEATLITRINAENAKNEYIYYFIKMDLCQLFRHIFSNNII